MSAVQVLRPNAARVMQYNASHNLPTLFPQAIRGVAPFSTTAPQCKRKTKDSNKKRGVSSLYRSGPREPLSMSSIPLPRPREFKPVVKVDPKHGLWGFFPEAGKVLWSPKETEEHGRAWTVEELRRKSWEDLHSLWWVCCRERNMLSTSKTELLRGKYGFGDTEFDQRDEEVRKTMRAIKHALTERYYTWQDAVEVAKSDPEINLEAGEGQVYTPSSYEEEYKEPEPWTATDPSTTNVDNAATQEAPKEATR